MTLFVTAAITGSDVAEIVIALLAGIYLIYVLVTAEKL
jgi:hypothetical protein